jgi:hypothetical protein
MQDVADDDDEPDLNWIALILLPWQNKELLL